MNHGKHTRLNNCQSRTFNAWKNNYISKELIDECNEMSSVDRKREMVDDLMKRIPDDVMIYRVKKSYHTIRLNNKRIRVLFVNIFSKDKIVTQV